MNFIMQRFKFTGSTHKLCYHFLKNRSMSDSKCPKTPKCEPKPVCDTYKTCPSNPPPKCIPDCTHVADGSDKLYRNISLFVAMPTLLLTAIFVFMKIEEDDLKPRPEYVPYSYLYRREKRFPWGDGNHSFFHNPRKNAVPPDGYEIEDPNAVNTNLDDEEE